MKKYFFVIIFFILINPVRGEILSETWDDEINEDETLTNISSVDIKSAGYEVNTETFVLVISMDVMGAYLTDVNSFKDNYITIYFVETYDCQNNIDCDNFNLEIRYNLVKNTSSIEYRVMSNSSEFYEIKNEEISFEESTFELTIEIPEMLLGLFTRENQQSSLYQFATHGSFDNGTSASDTFYKLINGSNYGLSNFKPLSMLVILPCLVILKKYKINQ